MFNTLINMKIITITFVLLSFVTSCNNAKTAATEANTEKPAIMEEQTKQVPSDYEIILEEPYGGLERPEDRVVRSDKELNEIYTIINRFRRPGLTPPNIDFTKETVIAIFIGEKSTGGHSIDVQAVKTTNKALEINYKIASPKAGEYATTAICQPFCFVKVPYVREKVVIKNIN